MAVIVPTDQFHPSWCHRRSCTAYAAEHDVERRYHRTSPRIIRGVDGWSYYLHVGSYAGGEGPYLEIAELAAPLDGPWWHSGSPHNELVMPLAQAAMVCHTMTKLLTGAVRTMPQPQLARPWFSELDGARTEDHWSGNRAAAQTRSNESR